MKHKSRVGRVCHKCRTRVPHTHVSNGCRTRVQHTHTRAKRVCHTLTHMCRYPYRYSYSYSYLHSCLQMTFQNERCGSIRSSYTCERLTLHLQTKQQWSGQTEKSTSAPMWMLIGYIGTNVDVEGAQAAVRPTRGRCI